MRVGSSLGERGSVMLTSASSLLSLCSQSYLQAASDGPAGHSLDPPANYNSPKFRSRNQSYMRAVSTLSQASCVSQVGPLPPTRLSPLNPAGNQQPGVFSSCVHMPASGSAGTPGGLVVTL